MKLATIARQLANVLLAVRLPSAERCVCVPLRDPVALTDRQTTLLAFLGAVPPERRGLDPVRIMKGLFLVSQELPDSDLPERAKYSFVPYDYGPFSREVYDDLDALRRAGLLHAEPVPGRSWSRHSVSEAAAGEVRGAVNRLNPRARDYIVTVSAWVSGQTFAGLLKTIYQRYPAYAANSVFQEPGGQ